ncbi:MAG: LPS-assembly protein LptD, partial [Candidatus Binatia bacterium]
FLFPTVGGSNREGFRYQQPFFWAISKSSDATFSVDVETRARIGLLGEYRTVLNKDTHGQINVSYFNEGLRKHEEDDIEDRTIADPEIPKDRWSVFARHRHSSPSGWMTYSNIFAFSDDLFTRELLHNFNLDQDQERSLRTGRYSRSSFGLLRGWGDAYFKGEWVFYQDFIQQDNRTLHRTPQLLFAGRRVLSGSPLELKWRAEGVNYVRREGADGLRVDLRPQISLPFRIPYLSGAFDVAPRETLYHLYHQEGSSDRNLSRELVEIRGRVGTSLSRVFGFDGPSLQKIKHVIEPELSYLFIPHSGERDIPILDGIDRINRRNLLTFSLINRIWGKFSRPAVARPGDQEVELLAPAETDIQEMGRLRLALSYDVDKERKRGDTLSDMDMNLRVTPADYVTLGFDTGLNPGPWQVTQAAVVLSLFDPRPITRRVADRDFMRPNYFDVSYRYIRRGFLAELADNSNLTTLTEEKLINRDVLKELGVNTMYHLTDHHLISYGGTYNARDGEFASNEVGIKILSKCECWTLGFTVKRRSNPDKTSVT